MTGDDGVQFTRGVEEEKAWISEHLARVRTPRPLLDVTMQLSIVKSVWNVACSHKSRLKRVMETGRTLLQRRDSLPSHQRRRQSNVEVELTHLEAMWHELETAIHQQKQRLEASDVSTDPGLRGHDPRLVRSFFASFILLLYGDNIIR